MNQRIIDDMPEIYEKVKPYINYLESIGFTLDNDLKYFSEHNEDNYTYFNGWEYPVPGSRADGNKEVIVDLVSFTGEPKIEIYKFSIIKTPKNYWCGNGQNKPPFILTNKRDDMKDGWESVIVDNIEDFKKEIGKFLNQIKKYNQRIKKYELEKDFT